jgi:hypothetical protein
VVVLGKTGRNFAAGMSGGVAYVLDVDGLFARRCNMGMVDLESLEDPDEIDLVQNLVMKHVAATGSTYVQRWMHPFSVGTGSINAVAAGNSDADPRLEIFIAGARTVRLDGVSRRVALEFDAGESRYCRDLVAADLTQDGSLELICLSMSNYGGQDRIVADCLLLPDLHEQHRPFAPFRICSPDHGDKR